MLISCWRIHLQQKVGKSRTEYKKSIPLHIRLAQKLQDETGENLLHREIEYIVTGHDKHMQGVLTKDFDGKYDIEYYWENKTFPVLDRVTGVVFPNVDFFQIQAGLFDN